MTSTLQLACVANEVSFTVYGEAQPQGSARAFVPKGWKRPVITSANAKLKPWRQEVTQVAMLAMREAGMTMFGKGDPVELQADFYFERPQSHSKKMRACPFKAARPDCDKLARSLCDSLTGIVYADDAQVAVIVVRKLYGSPARVEVKARRAE